MGFLRKSVKGAVLAKVASEARKPKNQAKAKSLLSSLKNRVSGGGSASSAKAGKGKGTSRTAAGKGNARKSTARTR